MLQHSACSQRIQLLSGRSSAYFTFFIAGSPILVAGKNCSARRSSYICIAGDFFSSSYFGFFSTTPHSRSASASGLDIAGADSDVSVALPTR